jgi:hypothetical protein
MAANPEPSYSLAQPNTNDNRDEVTDRITLSLEQYMHFECNSDQANYSKFNSHM